jgi:hypothetical protein
MSGVPHRRGIGAIALGVAAAGLLLYLAGNLLAMSPPAAPLELTPACHCVGIGPVALFGEVVAVVGLLLLPLALALALWGARVRRTTPPAPSPPESPDPL